MMGAIAQLASTLQCSLSAAGRLMQLSDLPSETEVVRRLPPPSRASMASASSSAGSGAGGRTPLMTDTVVQQQQRPGPLKTLRHSAAAACLGKAGRPSAAQQPCWLPPDGTSWPKGGAVTFHAVTAAYSWAAPAPALRSVSLKVPAGSSCALVGRSGSGKSTSVLALTGMIPLLKGERAGGWAPQCTGRHSAALGAPS